MCEGHGVSDIFWPGKYKSKWHNLFSLKKKNIFIGTNISTIIL